jgi:hypothetical protein
MDVAAMTYGWADVQPSPLYSACVAGNLDRAKVLVNAKMYRQEDLPGLFCVACESGNLELVQWFHGVTDVMAEVDDGGNPWPVPHPVKCTALSAACRSGNLELAQWVQATAFGPGFVAAAPATCLPTAFKNACRSGNLPLAQWVHGDGAGDGAGAPAPPGTLSAAFRDACLSGVLELAQWVYHLGPVDLHGEGEEAFLFACWAGNLALAQWIYDLDGQVNLRVCKQWALTNTTDLALLQWLYGLDSSVEVLPWALIQALEKACARGAAASAAWLWEQAQAAGATLDAPQAADCFARACGSGDLKFVQWVHGTLGLGAVCEKPQLTAKACASGTSLEVAKWVHQTMGLDAMVYGEQLLRGVAKTGSLPPSPVVEWLTSFVDGEALLLGACAVSLEAAQLVWSHIRQDTVGTETVVACFQSAVAVPDLALVQWLWSLGRMHGLPDIVLNGLNTEVAQWLVDQGLAISEEEVEAAFMDAVDCEEIQFARWLYGTGKVRRDAQCLGKALCSACMWGKVNTARWILTLSLHPDLLLDEYGNRAFIHACGSHQLEAAKWLVEQGVLPESPESGVVSSSVNSGSVDRKLDMVKYLQGLGGVNFSLEKCCVPILIRDTIRPGNTALVQWVYEHGGQQARAQIDSIFQLAMLAEDLDMVKWAYSLLGPGTVDSREVMIQALASDNPDLVVWLHEVFPQVDLAEAYGACLPDNYVISAWVVVHHVAQDDNWAWPPEVAEHLRALGIVV